MPTIALAKSGITLYALRHNSITTSFRQLGCEWRHKSWFVSLEVPMFLRPRYFRLTLILKRNWNSYWTIPLKRSLIFTPSFWRFQASSGQLPSAEVRLFHLLSLSLCNLSCCLTVSPLGTNHFSHKRWITRFERTGKERGWYELGHTRNMERVVCQMILMLANRFASPRVIQRCAFIWANGEENPTQERLRVSKRVKKLETNLALFRVAKCVTEALNRTADEIQKTYHSFANAVCHTRFSLAVMTTRASCVGLDATVDSGPSVS